MNKQNSSQEFIANSISAALRLVKAQFGPDAIIVSQSEVGGKVRVVALPANATLQTANSDIVVNKVSADKEDTLASLLAKNEENDEAILLQDDIFSATYLRAPISKKQENNGSSEIVADYIKNELATIKDLLKEKQTQAQAQPQDNKLDMDQQYNAHQLAIMRTLHKSKLQGALISQIVSSLPFGLSFEASIEYVIDKISDLIQYDKSIFSEKKIKSFLGPSGVGKSLLLAKLLIYYAQRPLNNNFAIIFVNNTNLKVLEESKVYARLFHVPTYYAESAAELDEAYLKASEKDYVFIDFPAYDFNLSDNNFYLNFLQKHREISDNTLVVSSHCSYPYLERFFNAFQKVLIDAVSITKLDENKACEEVLSFLLTHNLPLRNLSYGNLNFMNGFSSRLILGDKSYFQEHFTHLFAQTEKSV